MIFCIPLGTVIKVLENWLGVEEWMDVAKPDPAQAAQLLEDHIPIEAARKNIPFGHQGLQLGQYKQYI